MSGFFGITASGEENLVAATSFFWTDRSDYPEGLKQVIEKSRANVSADDKDLFQKSWDFEKLFPAYQRYYNDNLYQLLNPYFHLFKPDQRGLIPMSDPQFLEVKKLKGRLSWDAIEDFPTQYLKFVATQLYGYYWINAAQKNGDFYDYPLLECYKQLFVDHFAFLPFKDFERRQMLREFADPAPLSSYTFSEDKKVELVPTRSLSWHRAFKARVVGIIGSRVWIVLFGVLIGIGTVLFIVRRGRDASSFLFVILGLMSVGQALIVCLVETALVRYSIPMDFIVYLAPALTPLFFLHNFPNSGAQRIRSSENR